METNSYYILGLVVALMFAALTTLTLSFEMYAKRHTLQWLPLVFIILTYVLALVAMYFFYIVWANS